MYLPEHVLHEIFRHLDFHTVYFILKEVNNGMKGHVNNYITVIGEFLYWIKLKIVYVYRTPGSGLNIYCKSFASVPSKLIRDYNCSYIPYYFMWRGKIMCCFEQKVVAVDKKVVLLQHDSRTDTWGVFHKDVIAYKSIGQGSIHEH